MFIFYPKNFHAGQVLDCPNDTGRLTSHLRCKCFGLVYGITYQPIPGKPMPPPEGCLGYVYDCQRTICKNDEQNSLSDVSDWKTYKDEIYGFSFNYPSGWKLELKDYQFMRDIYILSLKAQKETNETKVGSPGFEIKVYEDFSRLENFTGKETQTSGIRVVEKEWEQSDVTGYYEKRVNILSSRPINISFWTSDGNDREIFTRLFNSFLLQ